MGTELMSYGSMIAVAMLAPIPCVARDTSLSSLLNTHLTAPYRQAMRTHTPNWQDPDPVYAEPVRSLLLVPFTACMGGLVGGAAGMARFYKHRWHMASFLKVFLTIVPHHFVFACLVAVTGERYTWHQLTLLSPHDWQKCDAWVFVFPLFALVFFRLAVWRNMQCHWKFRHIAYTEQVEALRKLPPVEVDGRGVPIV
eukprot:GDKI01043546.1.p2 GENE.GDKI01043546.1~~GDKI01043546.1.p2  ORF type:complete len:197 (+),score=48.53 GDKI01043546.1:1-591(+)